MNRRNLLKGFGAAALGMTTSGCNPNAFFSRPAANFRGLDAGKLQGIDTFVVLVMENRSFDHVLGARKLVEGRSLEGLTGAEFNPDVNGNKVNVFELDHFNLADPPHQWDACHAQWNGGLNDGFVRAHAGPTQAEAMGYYTREHVPVTWELADQFAVCDRWHASVLGPTFPNRYHLHGATSGGLTVNAPLQGMTSVLDLMDEAGFSSGTYYHDLPFQTAYSRFKGLAGMETFFADAAAGTLPNMCFVDPKFCGPDGNDDHPEKDIRLGQALIGSVYAALAASPQWSRCMLIVTYDEHGGFHDHVAPGRTVSDRPEFEQLGFRVPAIVAGPSIAAGSVVSTPLEHVSVISTVTRRFGLPSLNERVDATADLSGCIDSRLIGAPRTAPRLSAVKISRSDIRDRIAKGSKHVDHPEMQEIADQGGMPSHLDRRGDTDVMARVLEAGAALGAVELS